ncbi:MAG: hypothetical protein PHF36_02225 [Candidatus Cloacimonetes bacterium]|nr:hypothetical protein [Candidatus Cloacimonadota bacterium]
MQSFSNTKANIEFCGYWISPLGKYIGIEFDPFKTIWANLHQFDQDKNSMQELFLKYANEEDTIKEIIDYHLERGWIYAILKKSYWHFYAQTFNRATADRLWEWVYSLLNGTLSERNAYEKIKISFISDKRSFKTDLAQILIGDFFEGYTSLSHKIQNLIDNHIYYFLEEYSILSDGFIDNLKKI